jgi:hypothetical protein
MPEIAYPQELKKAFWDKKKGALDGAADLESALKTAEKKHDAVAWAAFAPGWGKAAAGDAAKLKALYEGLDKLYRTKASPLRLEAQSLAAAADKAAKAKDAAKPMKEACAVIAKAAMAYAKAVAEGLDALTQEYEQVAKALPKGGDKGGDKGDDADDEPSSALIDPKRLLKQLQLCKADAKRVVNFAMLDDGKQDPVLVLHPRLAGRAMLLKLTKDLGIKMGAFGQVSLDGMVLLLVVEKKVSGLTKRIRIPIRACGFKIGQVKQVDEKGQSLEEDLGDENEGSETEAQEGKAVAPVAPPRPPQLAEAALKLWSQAREAAVTVLKETARDIAALKDPESTKAIIELNAVMKNLTAEPRSLAQVAELMRYLDKDDVVLDVSDFASDIRTPLLKALAVLHKALPSA